jgi:hypothetical protein
MRRGVFHDAADFRDARHRGFYQALLEQIERLRGVHTANLSIPPVITGNMNFTDQQAIQSGDKPKPSPASSNDVGSDPTKLLFMSFDKNRPGDYSPTFEKVDVDLMGGNPTVHYDRDATIEGKHLYPDDLVRVLREHVQKYGPLKELMIDGHGRTNHEGLVADLDTEQFLREVKTMQEDLGLKVADRIEFVGCSVFAGLSAEDVEFYKLMAQDLKAHIVGSTTPTFVEHNPGGSLTASGHYWEFTPDGDVQKDRLYDAQWEKLHLMSDPDFAKDETWLARELHPLPMPVVPSSSPSWK